VTAFPFPERVRSSDRRTGPLEYVDYRRVETPEEKDEIYRLRYRAILREGAILPSASERVTDRFDELPNTFIFGIYVHDELLSSIRVSVLTSEFRESPSAAMFADLLYPELDRGKVIIDPTRFVADPEKARSFPELPYISVRLAYVACEHFNADIGLANVRPEHRAFYRKVFLQEAWGEPRLYPGLIKPMGLMAARYPEIKERVFHRFPYMRSSAFERRMLFDRPSVVDFPNRQTGLKHRIDTVSVTQTDGDIQRETAEIIHRISKWAGGDRKARFWFRSEEIPAFGGRTAEALVREGRAAEVRDFLDHVALGGYA
jgi:hypothetical protein